jgi:DNA processing protein
MSNLFDRSSQQKFTWQSKHIKFFLDLKGIGPSAVEKIIEINPDIEQWDREYVASQSANYAKTMNLLKDVEEIPELDNLDENMVIHFKEANFPENLANMIKDKPLLLWYKGNLNIGKSVAVVGSRNMIPETAKIVDDFVDKACEENFNIVSGLAIGVDTQAHKAALKNNSKTVAILPSSLDNIVPYQNKELAFQIVENGGLLLSEYPIGSSKKIESSNYIQRNRLQAGISDAVFIAQSGIPGGTMTTAKHAIDNEKKLIVYLSKNMSKEYLGNKYLTDALDKNYEFSKMKFNKSQIEKLILKKTLADEIIYSNKNEIDKILRLI